VFIVSNELDDSFNAGNEELVFELFRGDVE
jgi:hypothetical protein